MSVSLPALVVATAIVIATPSDARGQACCAGGGAYLPARLKLHEDELVGIQVRANDDLGSLDPNGRYVADPPGASELDLTQDLVGAVRVFSRGQVGVDVPFVETRRTAGGLGDFGGGVGDASLGFRYDLVYAAESAHLPGMAITVGVTAPTGRPPEQAHSPLLTDATGTGTWQGLVGGEIEEVFGSFIATADVLVSGSAPRSVGGVSEQLGPQLSGFGALGYLFPRDAAVAVVVSTAQSLSAVLNGQPVAGSGRGLTTASLAAGLPVTEAWRLQGSLNADLTTLGRNRPTGLGATFTVVRAWL